MDCIDAENRGLQAILRKAGELLDDAASVYQAAGYPIKAARLKGMARQIDDELTDLDRKLFELARAAKK
jgi:hypothetical protein